MFNVSLDHVYTEIELPPEKLFSLVELLNFCEDHKFIAIPNDAGIVTVYSLESELQFTYKIIDD